MATVVSPELNILIADLGNASIKATFLANRVIAEVAENIESSAKSLCPVRSGRTRDSIGITHRALSAEIGPTTFYARFLEYGTSKMGPHAFMGPALDLHGGELEVGLAKAASL